VVSFIVPLAESAAGVEAGLEHAIAKSAAASGAKERISLLH
jgi:hypothetical protein